MGGEEGRKGGKEDGKEEGRDEGRKEGREEERKEGGKGRKEIKQSKRHCRPGSRGSQVDFFFFERRKEKKNKISKGEEERGRERGRVNGNIALF